MVPTETELWEKTVKMSLSVRVPAQQRVNSSHKLRYFKEILIKTLSDVSGISRVGGEGWAGQLLEPHQRELCGQSLWENQWLWQRDTHSQPAGRDYPEKTHSPPTASAARAPRWLNRMKLEGRWLVGVHTGQVSRFRELVDGESGRETRRAIQQMV